MSQSYSCGIQFPSISSLSEKNIEEDGGKGLKVSELLSLRGHDIKMLASLLGRGLHDELWVHGEGEVVFTHRHLQVTNFDQVNQYFRNWDLRHSVWLHLIHPWNNHIKSKVEELSDLFVGVSSFQIIDDWRSDLGLVHFDCVPFGCDVHTFKPHVKVSDNIVVLDGQVVLGEVLVPHFNFHAVFDVHLLSVEDEARGAKVLDTSAQGHVITEIVSQIRNEVLKIGCVPVNGELDARQIFI